jgi:outer membrane protein assembly factor BamD
LRGRTARIAALVLLAWLTACASNDGAEQVLTADEQYARALQLFEDEEFPDAISALQTFTFNYPQDPRIIEARWLIARIYYDTEDWATAAQEFLDFQRDYPSHERAAEAVFLAGRSFQRMSLRPELDQRDTERAINVYDRLLREYPGSAFEEEARERRSQLRNKLAEKAYINGEFYFDNEVYDGAELYLTNVIRDFPDSDWLAPAYALLARTYCEWGRLDKAVEMQRVLHDQFPEASATREVERTLEPRCRGPAVESSR